MSDTINDCAICHEKLENELYTLPECNHTYHINCIMTWFRSNNSSKKCPLCNQSGINNIKDLTNVPWISRKVAQENYKHMRILSRKKNAPKELVKKVEKLKKMEDNEIKFKKDFKNFKESKHPDLTVNEIMKKHNNYNIKQWKIHNNIKLQKELIGFQQNIVNIIIPVKKEI